MAALCDNGDFFKPKMKGAILIAPVSRVNNMMSPWVQKIKQDQKAFDYIKSMGPEIMTAATASNNSGKIIANLTSSFSDLVMSNASDSDPTKISKVGAFNNNRFFPSGSCFRQIHHYHQLLNNGGFRKFDHGPEINKEKYGQDTPPDYDLQKIKGCNIILVCGTNDLMASTLDYTWLRDELKPNNNIDFWEYELGHTSLVTPLDKTHITHMFEKVVQLNA